MASVAEEAAEWLLRLEEEPSDAALLEEFQCWQAQDPAHALAVKHMQGLIAQLEGLRPQSGIAHHALEAGITQQHRRKQLKRGVNLIATALVLALPFGMLLQHYPLAYWLSDLRTSTAEWQSAQLPDHSQITLSGHSAVDVDFTAQARTIHLRQGEILIDVAKDATRPFVVNTAHGSVTALGTRFVVSEDGQTTAVAMLESRTKVATMPSTAQQSAVVTQGEAIRITSQGLGQIHVIDPASISDAWRLHQLVVQDQPLSEVLAVLARHRKGYLHFNAEAFAHYQVTAVLPLDDTDKALQLLSESFPVRVKRFTPWIVTVQNILVTDSH